LCAAAAAAAAAWLACAVQTTPADALIIIIHVTMLCTGGAQATKAAPTSSGFHHLAEVVD
jgi:hypothetical protein